MSERSVIIGMAMKIDTNIKNKELVDDKRKLIVKSALKLFLAKGYSATTVREIANTSNISMGTLYNYINKKEDILYLVYAEMLGIIHGAILSYESKTDDPMQKLLDSVRVALDVTLQKLGDHVLILYREGANLSKESLKLILKEEAAFVKHFEDIIAEGKKVGVFGTDDPRFAANIVAFLVVFGIMRKWNLKGYSTNQIVDRTTNFILKGVFSK